MKKLHIISHTHWDREWYLPFEKHRHKLIDLINELINLLESNPDFKSFHLDGHTIILEDYLEIFPKMRERLTKLIKDKRIIIGPWYVLQDEFLTSGEANIRNLQIGISVAKEFGEPLMLGYFPDSFGNIAQAPQILKGFNIDRACFGRGLFPVGYNNTVLGNDKKFNSEMIWESPDGSQVTSVLLANWYHNAMELPIEDDLLKERINQIIDQTSKYASTKHLLGMNGCDHQPIQQNLPEVIKKAGLLFKDTEIIISDFEQYFDAIMKEKPKLRTHRGEIVSQYTDGYYTLVSTASSRIYTKQLNYQAQSLLTHITEPIASLDLLLNSNSQANMLIYTWKKLMEIHTHDTICGCSTDRVHEDMVVITKKSIDASESIRDKAYENFSLGVRNTNNIIVFNGNSKKKKQLVTAIIDFPEDKTNLFFNLHDENDNLVEISVKNLGRTFTYDLPKDRFREVVYTNRYEISFVSSMNGIGFKNYKLSLIEEPLDLNHNFIIDKDTYESETLKIKINKNGSFDLHDKIINKKIYNQNIYEDTGDMGNEYEYFQSEDKNTILSNNTISSHKLFSVDKHSLQIEITSTLNIPRKLDGKNRSLENVAFDIKTYLTIYHHNRRVDINIVMDNHAENHRFRALFNLNNDIKQVIAEGQFALINRPTHPWEGWKNPSYLNRFETFVLAQNDSEGLLVASKGLHEYELDRKGYKLAITLLRSVGELGDWGVFPTPEAQCLGKQSAQLMIMLYDDGHDKHIAINEAYTYAHSPMIAKQGILSKSLPEQFIEVEGDFIYQSALKPAEDENGVILRVFSLKEEKTTFIVKSSNENLKIIECNMAEEKINKENILNKEQTIKAMEIKTFRITNNKKEII